MRHHADGDFGAHQTAHDLAHDHMSQERGGADHRAAVPRSARAGGSGVARRLTLAALWLVFVLAAGMVSAGSAAAAPSWLLCVERAGTGKYEDDQCTKTSGEGKWESVSAATKGKVVVRSFTLELLDTKTALGVSGARCPNGGEAEGTVGSGGEGETTAVKVKEAAANCVGRGGCEKVEEVKGVHLPWKTKLSEGSSEMVRTKIEGTGGGAGWAVTCKTLLGSKTDECVSEEGKPEEISFLNEVIGGILLVSGTLADARKAKCTEGGKEAGEDTGQLATLSVDGCGLSVNKAGSGSGSGECLGDVLGAGFTTDLTPNTECHNKVNGGNCLITVKNLENTPGASNLNVEIQENLLLKNPRLSNSKWKIVRNTCTEGTVLNPGQTCEVETQLQGNPPPNTWKAEMLIETVIGTPTPRKVRLTVQFEAT